MALLRIQEVFDQEDQMKTLFKASSALVIVLSLSGAAYPLGTGMVAPSHRTVHHMANFAKATALVAPAFPAARSPSLPETDGLSRNDEDCNYGCIDH